MIFRVQCIKCGDTMNASMTDTDAICGNCRKPRL